MFQRASRENRATLMGRNIDQIFKKLGIDPGLASFSAFEAETIIPVRFGQEMVIRRAGQGVGRRQLAQKLGYTDETVLRWETGRTSPTIMAAADWAAGLGLDLTLKLSRVPGQEG